MFKKLFEKKFSTAQIILVVVLLFGAIVTVSMVVSANPNQCPPGQVDACICVKKTSTTSGAVEYQLVPKFSGHSAWGEKVDMKFCVPNPPVPIPTIIPTTVATAIASPASAPAVPAAATPGCPWIRVTGYKDNTIVFVNTYQLYAPFGQTWSGGLMQIDKLVFTPSESLLLEQINKVVDTYTWNSADATFWTFLFRQNKPEINCKVDFELTNPRAK